MQRALKGKKMRARELAEAVLAMGYRTTSTQFPKIVHQQLNAPGSRFKRLSRGLYTVK